MPELSVRPEERRRYQFGLGFNAVAGVIWLVMLVATGAWYFGLLLAVCAVIGGLSGWALLTLRRDERGHGPRSPP